MVDDKARKYFLKYPPIDIGKWPQNQVMGSGGGQRSMEMVKRKCLRTEQKRNVLEVSVLGDVKREGVH